MNYIYGPVESRRLGTSLGVTIIPYKYCPLNCVYCQLKSTSKFTLQRREYVKSRAVLLELQQFLKSYPDYKKIDYITVSGSGEPMLNSKIKDIILGIKKLTSIPVAMITNSILLCDPQVREEILDLDLILPSLDAITQDIFQEIDRSFSSKIKIEQIIDGLIQLRKEFSGKIWIEIMLIKGINDDLEYLKKFRDVVLKINPDRIQLNVPSRPPSEVWVKIPASERLKKIQSIFGINCELV